MTKFDLIELLKSNREDTSRLELKKREKTKYEIELEQLKKIENETNMTTSFGINNDIHSKNMISDKVSKAAIKKVETEAELKQKIADIEIEIKTLEDRVVQANIRLNGLYYKERMILTAYYIDNRSAEDIANNYYLELFNRTCSPRYIRNIIEKGTKKMLDM